MYNEWTVEIPKEVVSLSLLLEAIEDYEEEDNNQYVDIPFRCSKKDALEMFKRITLQHKLAIMIRDFNDIHFKQSHDEIHSMYLAIYDIYHSYKNYFMNELYDWISPKGLYLNHIQEFKNKLSPIYFYNLYQKTKQTIVPIHTFSSYCGKGHIEIAEWIYYKWGGITTEGIKISFLNGLSYFPLNVLQWIYHKIHKINFTSDDIIHIDIVFREDRLYKIRDWLTKTMFMDCPSIVRPLVEYLATQHILCPFDIDTNS